MLELTQQSNLAQPYSPAEQVTPESAPISNLPKLAKEPVRPPADRVVVFIDEANLYHAARSRGIKIDSPQLLKTLKDRSTDFQAIAYVAVDRQNPHQKNFLSMLKRHGVELVTQEVVHRCDGSIFHSINSITRTRSFGCELNRVAVASISAN